MSDVIRAASSGADWVRRPNGAMVRVVHIDNGHWSALCYPRVSLAAFDSWDAAEVPEESQCRRPACAKVYRG